MTYETRMLTFSLFKKKKENTLSCTWTQMTTFEMGQMIVKVENSYPGVDQ